MLEPEFSTADTARRDFPWRTVALFGFLAFLAGAMSLYFVFEWASLSLGRAAGLLAASALFLAQGWFLVRKAVSTWQQQFGKDVEYVARRVREHEAGLRFQGPHS